jgi:hypothetical protein
MGFRPHRLTGRGSLCVSLMLLLASSFLPRVVQACSGPPPLSLELHRIPPNPEALRIGQVVTLQLRLRDTEDEGRFSLHLPGSPVPGSTHRIVRLDTSRQNRQVFTTGTMGPIPDMLLQWGGFDPMSPWDLHRRRGYALEIHQVGSPLPPPPGWEGAGWDPAEERWYAETGHLMEDDEVLRWIHRNMGGRFGEEPEPWLKLQKDARGIPQRLHLWILLQAHFENPNKLFLQLEPKTPGSVQVLWDWGDGTQEDFLRGSPGDPLEVRLRAHHIYRRPSPEGGFSVSTQLRLNWLFGGWARGGEPWIWSGSVRYLGSVDLASLASEMTPKERDLLQLRIQEVRSRLRCLPGDRNARVFSRGAPCNCVSTPVHDRFLDSDGDAIYHLLHSLLPERLQDRARDLKLGGPSFTHPLRYVFSGSFPQFTAPLKASLDLQRAWGSPGKLSLQVQ